MQKGAKSENAAIRKKKETKKIYIIIINRKFTRNVFSEGKTCYFFFFQKFTEFQTETAEHKTQTSSKRNMQKEGIINS